MMLKWNGNLLRNSSSVFPIEDIKPWSHRISISPSPNVTCFYRNPRCLSTGAYQGQSSTGMRGLFVKNNIWELHSSGMGWNRIKSNQASSPRMNEAFKAKTSYLLFLRRLRSVWRTVCCLKRLIFYISSIAMIQLRVLSDCGTTEPIFPYHSH